MPCSGSNRAKEQSNQVKIGPRSALDGERLGADDPGFSLPLPLPLPLPVVITITITITTTTTTTTTTTAAAAAGLDRHDPVLDAGAVPGHAVDARVGAPGRPAHRVQDRRVLPARVPVGRVLDLDAGVLRVGVLDQRGELLF